MRTIAKIEKSLKRVQFLRYEQCVVITSARLQKWFVEKMLPLVFRFNFSQSKSHAESSRAKESASDCRNFVYQEAHCKYWDGTSVSLCIDRRSFQRLSSRSGSNRKHDKPFVASSLPRKRLNGCVLERAFPAKAARSAARNGWTNKRIDRETLLNEEDVDPQDE